MMIPAIERRRSLRDDDLSRYTRMFEIREFEERLNELFASGVIHGTTHLAIGQEALAVALATELRETDLVTATYRGHAIALALGLDPQTVLAEIMGKASGPTGGLGGSMHLGDINVGLLPTFAIVGAGIPVAAGAALAFQYRAESSIAVSVFGDGATNIGAFHEGLNLAAIWNLPVVFLCDNNMYGEYSRIDRTTPIEDLHIRARSYDMPSLVVDGMSVPKVRVAIATAVERARNGGGPTLIEAKTYRFAGHSRADTAPYRPAGELDAWAARDPIKVARADLLHASIPEAALNELEEAVRQSIAATIEQVRASDDPVVEDMFSHVWTRAR